MKIVFLILVTSLVVESRPQLTEVKQLLQSATDVVTGSAKKIGTAVQGVAMETATGLKNVGKEVGGLVDDVLNTGSRLATGVTKATGDVTTGGMKGVREVLDASTVYVEDNVKDFGEFSSGLVGGKLGTISLVVDTTGNYVANLTGATVGLLQRILGAGGKLVVEIVGNTVDLADKAGGVVGRVANEAVTAFTGYEKEEPTVEVLE